jgi:HAD superfamily hydrolase (TIGR01490 family)
MTKMRDYLKTLCTGWDAQQVAAIVDETLHDIVDPLVYDEAVALIEEHHAAGRDVVIISSSGEEIVAGVGAMLGADHAIGTRMVVADGKYTGEIEFYSYGPHKAEAMVELAAKHGYDLAASYAYSDSFTDAPMLEVVGHPTAVNPDKALRRLAVERDWPVMEFARPVSLRSRVARMAPPPRRVLVGAAGLGAAAMAYRLLSRRRDRGAGSA